MKLEETLGFAKRNASAGILALALAGTIFACSDCATLGSKGKRAKVYASMYQTAGQQGHQHEAGYKPVYEQMK